MTTAITSWGDALKTSVANALSVLLSAIPKIIGFALILLIGWFIASLIAKAVSALLHRINFNTMAERSGLAAFVGDMGITTDASTFVASLAKWFIRLIVLVTAFDALGLPAVSGVLQRLLLWLPNLLVALVVLVIGGLAATALGRLVRGFAADSGLGNPDLLEKVTRVAVWAFAILIAVNQIGVATTLINTLFLGFVGALALALGLAFGLGGRDTAGEIVRGWYHRGQQAAGTMPAGAAMSADEAQRRIEQAAAAENGGSAAPASGSARTASG